MTPANPDALADALARELARLDGWQDPDALWTDNLGIIARGGEGSPVYLDYVEDAGKLIAGPLAPLLADLQQQAASISSLEESVNNLEADLQRVTAENARAEDERFAVAYTTARGAMDYEHMARVLSGRLRRMDRRAAAANRRADAAEARAAQLQAEVEAKDRVRWLPIATAPTDRPVVVRMKTDRLQGGWFVATVTLPDPDDDSRFGSCSTIWHYNGDTLLTQFRGTWTEWLDDGGSDRTALAARAATAREGA